MEEQLARHKELEATLQDQVRSGGAVGVLFLFGMLMILSDPRFRWRGGFQDA